MEYQNQEVFKEKAYNCLTINKKCGDILVQTNKKFYIVCCFCIIRFTGFEEFTTHYAKEHFDDCNDLLDVIKSKEYDEGGDLKSEMDIVVYSDNDIETSDTCVQENYRINETRIEPTSTTLIETDLVEESVNGNKKNACSSNSINITKLTANSSVKTSHSKRNQANSNTQSIFVNKCDFDSCGKTFSSEIFLHKHKMNDHLPVDPFFGLEDDLDCKREDDDQISIQSLQKQLSDTDDEIDANKCRYCPRIYKCKTLRIQHERIHTTERPFKCETCGKCFSNLKYCKQHELFHTGIKPFKCDMCDASFSVNSSLKRHILRHKGLKTFSCSYCGKKFIDSTSKRIHERVHTGEKPYQCADCGKCFTACTVLLNHRKSFHMMNPEKPYKCEICNKSFTMSHLLKSHSATHSDVKPFMCKICNKSFKFKRYLRRHSKIHLDESCEKYL